MLVHGGNFGEGVLDFSVNTNPCLTKEMMTDLLLANVDRALSYPEIDGDGLLHFVARNIGVDPTRLVLGSGATDCLYQAMQILKPATALVVEPTYSEYRQAMKNAGARVEGLPYNLMEHSGKVEKDLLDKVKKLKPDLVAICNPNNPTGHCYSRGFIKELTELQKSHKGYVLLDESFRFFENLDSCYTREDWNLMVLTSLSEFYGIPGLPFGYLTGNFSLIADMKHLQTPWKLNGLAAGIFRTLMTDRSFLETSKVWYSSEKHYMTEKLSRLEGLTVLQGHANYLLCHLKNFKGSDINDWLLMQAEPLAIRECSSFDGLSDHYIRIGLKGHEDNVKLIEKLSTYWKRQ